MSMRKLFILAALSLSTLVAASGCSTEVADDDEMTEESEAELTKAGKALIGSYKDDSGSFRGIILTNNKVGQANEFIADVSTGIVCVTTPCPSSEKIKGTFTAGTKTITFKSTTASPHVQHLLGRYNYLVQGAKFSLWKGKTFAQSLEKVDNYCSESSDCYAQDILHPMCWGLGFTCTPQNTCDWSCSQPPPLDPCIGRPLETCNGICQPKFGPSACTPDGRICTADMGYKGCQQAPQGTVCMSSNSCAPGEHCSTEDGVCNSSGMLAVCSGTCVN
jgi:hypothetical protein